MSRRGTRSKHMEQSSVIESVTVIAGAIRNLNESDGLAVELGISPNEVSMRSGDTELGAWPIDRVDVSPIDMTSFEFNAEGDRLIFTPTDPVAFRGSLLLTRLPIEDDRRRKRRRSRKAAAGSQRAPERDTARRDGKPRSEREPKPKKQRSAKPTKEAKVKKKDPQAQKLPKKPRIEKKPRKEKRATESGQEKVLKKSRRQKAPKQSRRDKKAAAKVTPTRSLPSFRPKATAAKEKGPSLWIRSLDLARKYDILGLDRVQVDERLRGGEHQHTWDHRIAASFGAGSRICTICGKVRLRTG